MILQKIFKINQQLILDNEVLNSHVIQFWKEVFPTIDQNNKQIKHLMVLCKVKYSVASGPTEIESGYKTLGPLRRVEFKDLELFSNYLSDRLGILIDSYNSNTISEIILLM